MNTGSDGIVKYDVAIERVGNVTLPNVQNDEAKLKQLDNQSQTFDSIDCAKAARSGSESDCSIIDKGMNWDSQKSLLHDLKSLVTKLNVQHSEWADLGHSFVESESDFVTDDYKSNDHTYCTANPQSLEAEITIGLEAAAEQSKSNLADSDRNFSKENNQMLHLVMKTLQSVNKNIRGNSKNLMSLDSRIITLEGNSEAGIVQLKSRLDEQELACDEMI